MPSSSPMILQPQILSSSWAGYQLIDSGNQRKLERFGETIVIRSEPKAWWKPDLDDAAWSKAHAIHDDKTGLWKIRKAGLSRAWLIPYRTASFQARLTDGSKHLGIFPEQSPHWDWVSESIRSAGSRSGSTAPRVLNLFGYTGAASIAATAAGAAVTHVDASKPSVGWARENQKLSHLDDAPIRWLIEDALKYVQREIRRGSQYEGIMLDPPSFGRGPKGEVWKVEEQIVSLLGFCRQLLSPDARFLVLTLYNLEASSLMLRNLVSAMLPAGQVTFGELALTHQHSDKQLPLSLWCRWSR